MKPHYAVLLLILIAAGASASELKLSGSLQQGRLSVTIQNRADYAVSFSLRFQLKQKEGDWRLLETLNCSVNSSLAALDSAEYSCPFALFDSPGEYKIFAKADIANSTYTYKNFEFRVGENGFEPPAPESDVVLRFVSVPDRVKTGEEFRVIVNVTAYKDMLLDIYSYVYDGKRCLSFWGWKGNSRKLSFRKGETISVNLSDSVSHKAENGSYRLKVRARGDRDYDIIRAIEVIQTKPELFMNLSDVDASQPAGSDTDVRILLPLLAGIPLLLLLARKML